MTTRIWLMCRFLSHVYLSRPFWAAAPPGIILVMKMEGSSPMWGLSVPPAILNPRPELPWTYNTDTVGKKIKNKQTQSGCKPLLLPDATTDSIRAPHPPLKEASARYFYPAIMLADGKRCFFFILNLSKLQHNTIRSSFNLKPASCLRLRSCVFVRRVFKADPVKQTEPGHGRIEWRRVGESEGGRERESLG